MLSLVWLPPLIKALATGLIVVAASVVAETLGPFWGAMVASLPVSAGPAYVFLAMRHGEDFAAASALDSFAANAATGVFLIVYGALARRVAPWRGLGAAVLAWLSGALLTGLVAGDGGDGERRGIWLRFFLGQRDRPLRPVSFASNAAAVVRASGSRCRGRRLRHADRFCQCNAWA